MSIITDLLSGDHRISLQKAIDMTTLYRAEKDKILEPQYRGKDILCQSEIFSNAAFRELLAEPGCVALRIYFGMDVEKNVKLIIVGVNDKNEDILPSGPGGGSIMDEGVRCPPICPVPGPLNG